MKPQTNFTRNLLAVPAALWLGLLGAGASCAQTVPALMNFQGRLTDASNNPLTGPHNLTFQIFDAAAAGNSLWGPEAQSVTVTNGVFSAQLGAVVPLTAPVLSGSTGYLLVTVDGTPMNPRSQLITSPYAFNAQLVQGHNYQFFVSTDAAAQSIAGAKTFTGTVNVPAPVSASNAATKAYVDAQATGASGWSLSGAVVMLTTPSSNVVIASTLTVQGNAFSVGGSTLVATNGLIGIGTTAPSDLLTISKNAATAIGASIVNPNVSAANTYVSLVGDGAQGFMESDYNNSGAGNTSLIDVASAGMLRTGATATGGLSIFTQAAGAPLRFGTGGFASANERVRIDGSGNVGIGTTAPAATLDVNGAATLRANVLLPTGKLGVGTASPSAKIHVSGGDLQVGDAAASTVSASGYVTLAGLASSPAGSPGRVYYSSTAFGGQGALMIALNSGAYVPISTGAAAGGIATVAVDAGEFGGNGTSGSPLSLLSSSVTMQGNAFNGPNQLLRLDGGALVPAAALPTAAGQPYLLRAGDSMTGQLTLVGSTLTVKGNAFSVGGSNFKVAGSSVGISTGIPVTALDVNGGVTFRSSMTLTGIAAPPLSAAGQGAIYYDSTANQFMASQNGGAYLPLGGGGWSVVGSVISPATPSNNVVVTSTLTVQGGAFSVAGATLAVTSGSVGIGTSSPASRVHVSGGDLQVGDANASTVSAAGYMTLAGLPASPAGSPGRVYYSSTAIGGQGALMLALNSGAFVPISTGVAAGGIASVAINASEFGGDGTSGNPLFLLSSSATMQGNTFNGPNRLVLLDAGGLVPASSLPSTAGQPYVLRGGDAMTGPLTLAGSTLTVNGSAFSVGGGTFSISAGSVVIGSGTVASTFSAGGFFTMANVAGAPAAALPGRVYYDKNAMGGSGALMISLNNSTFVPISTYSATVGSAQWNRAAGNLYPSFQGDNVTVFSTLTVSGNSFSVGLTTFNVTGGGVMIGAPATNIPVQTFYPLSIFGFGGSGTGHMANIVGVGGYQGPRFFVSNANYGYTETDNYLYNANAPGSRYAATFGAGAEGYYSNGGVLSGYDYFIYDYNAGAYRFLIDQSGKIGISTGIPATMLDVNGGVTVRSSMTLAGMAAPPLAAAGQGALYFDSTANRLLTSENGGAYSRLNVWPSAGGVAQLDAGLNAVIPSTLTIQGNAFSVGGTLLAVTGGNTGFGTASPQTVVDVNGAAQFGAGAAKSTFTATPGNTVYALALSSGLSVAGTGGVSASFFSGAHFGNGAGLTGVTAANLGAGAAGAVPYQTAVGATSFLPMMGAGGAIFGTNGIPSTGTISGTVNRITVSTNASGAGITLNLPQDINPGAAPTFAGANFTALPAGQLTGAVPAVSVSLSTVATTGTCTLPNVLTAISNTAVTCSQPSNVTGNAATATGVAGGAAGNVPYQSGAGATAFLPIIGAGGAIFGSNGVPSTGTIAGTLNQITVSTNATSAGITLSLPQSINSGAAPTFAGTNFTGLPAAQVTGAVPNVSIDMSTVTTALAAKAADAAVVHLAGAESVTGAKTFGAAVTFWSRTIAQLIAVVPVSVGETYFCSNCAGAVGATGKIVVSTGTAAGQFADAAGGIFK